MLNATGEKALHESFLQNKSDKGELYPVSEILLKGISFDAYLEKYQIFEKTTQYMMECLENWHRDDPE